MTELLNGQPQAGSPSSVLSEGGGGGGGGGECAKESWWQIRQSVLAEVTGTSTVGFWPRDNGTRTQHIIPEVRDTDRQLKTGRERADPLRSRCSRGQLTAQMHQPRCLRAQCPGPEQTAHHPSEKGVQEWASERGQPVEAPNSHCRQKAGLWKEF